MATDAVRRYRARMNRRRFLVASGTAALVMGAGALYWPERWRYIVIHHSAGTYGTIEFLQRVHRDRQADDPIDAIPYHYVIGNGNGLAMGEVVSDWRKEYNLWGTHVSAHNPARNFLGIGICLIGNFDKTDVPAGQFDALVRLTRQLMHRYTIAAGNVGFHGQIEGESTHCPGSKFPFEALRQAIA